MEHDISKYEFNLDKGCIFNQKYDLYIKDNSCRIGLTSINNRKVIIETVGKNCDVKFENSYYLTDNIKNIDKSASCSFNKKKIEKNYLSFSYILVIILLTLINFILLFKIKK